MRYVYYRSSDRLETREDTAMDVWHGRAVGIPLPRLGGTTRAV